MAKCFFLAIYSMMIGSGLAAPLSFPSIFSSTPIKRFKTDDYQRFNLIERELRNLVAANGSSQINNIFCTAGFVFPDGDLLTSVIWTNKGQLYLWEGSVGEPAREESITLMLSPYSDLKNAVEDGLILGGSTTVNRSQAQSAIEDCEKYGQKFLIRPFTPAKQKRENDEDF